SITSSASVIPRPPSAPLFPYTTLFRSHCRCQGRHKETAGEGTLASPSLYELARRPRERLVGAVELIILELGELRVGQLVVLVVRSEEHTSELQSRENLVCRLLLVKKNS